MSSKEVSIQLSSYGKFRVDEVGIRSLEPVLVTSKWNGNKLIIESEGVGGISSGLISSGNISLSGCNVSSFGGNTMHVNGMKITVARWNEIRAERGLSPKSYFGSISQSNGRTTIDGITVTPELLSGNSEKAKKNPAKIWSLAWKDKFGPETCVSINNITCDSGGYITVAGYLSNDVDVTVIGSGDVHIDGNYPNTRLSINIAGSGKVMAGDGIFQSIHASIAGSGNIKNFYVLGRVKASIAGSGDIKMRCHENCKITKSIAGSGTIRIANERQRRIANERQRLQAKKIGLFKKRSRRKVN